MVGDRVIEVRLEQRDKTIDIRTEQSEKGEKGQRYIGGFPIRKGIKL